MLSNLLTLTMKQSNWMVKNLTLIMQTVSRRSPNPNLTTKSSLMRPVIRVKQMSVRLRMRLWRCVNLIFLQQICSLPKLPQLLAMSNKTSIKWIGRSHSVALTRPTRHYKHLVESKAPVRSPTMCTRRCLLQPTRNSKWELTTVRFTASRGRIPTCLTQGDKI